MRSEGALIRFREASFYGDQKDANADSADSSADFMSLQDTKSLKGINKTMLLFSRPMTFILFIQAFYSDKLFQQHNIFIEDKS